MQAELSAALRPAWGLAAPQGLACRSSAPRQLWYKSKRKKFKESAHILHQMVRNK